MVSHFTINSQNQISYMLYKTTYILHKISDILYKTSNISYKISTIWYLILILQVILSLWLRILGILTAILDIKMHICTCAWLCLYFHTADQTHHYCLYMLGIYKTYKVTLPNSLFIKVYFYSHSCFACMVRFNLCYLRVSCI